MYNSSKHELKVFLHLLCHVFLLQKTFDFEKGEELKLLARNEASFVPETPVRECVSLSDNAGESLDNPYKWEKYLSFNMSMRGKLNMDIEYVMLGNH